ncbi:unnamed protein product [Brassicogethes aeneus]|uniref:Uncharacterized protein n=1 Tax=Brassicogethes aeneus TaxID=1431903 RepID=A0A9P0AUS0_BRAAE|nr:unnamed protein product [Brassicogethes aeneus]
MLSYMLPPGGDEKPPAGPPPATHNGSNGNGRLQLAFAGAAGATLTNGRGTTPLSKETSVSSFASDVTTATHSSMTPTSNASEKGKPKLIVNAN